jgi:glycosyltransferase involved in cell wall biosynthesis
LQTAGLVSIIIVAHNNWPDLELAIQSALHQSYRPVEVIVVDNASSDETGRVTPALFGNRVRYLRQANTGEGGGRNTGVRLSAGEFIQFLDGDDFLMADKVEKQIAVLKAAPEIDIVYGDIRQFQSAAGPATWEDWDIQEYDDMLAILLTPPHHRAGLYPHSVLFRRRALDHIGPWLEDPPAPDGISHRSSGADQDYWLRAAYAGCRFRYCPGSLCLYRRRPGQLSADSRAEIRGKEQALTRALEYIAKEPYRGAALRRLGKILFYLAVTESDTSTALSTLRRARHLGEPAITRRGYLVAWLLIVTRLGSVVFGKWLRPVRRLAAKAFGM